MELLLQKRISYQTTHSRRRKMIEEQGLHIKDKINYVRLQELHERYAPELTEVDFARYFLDIDYLVHYKLKSGDKDNVIILEREFYREEEFDEIEEKIREKIDLQSGFFLNREILNELWNEYGGRFSLKMFAKEIFDLNDRKVTDLVSGNVLNTAIQKRKHGNKQNTNKSF